MVNNNQIAQLSLSEFHEFREYLKQIAGIDLGDNKQYLVETRLKRILSEYNCNATSDLVSLIKKPTNGKIRQQVIDVMTTNETFWFRDVYPYEYLKSTILPDLSKSQANGRFRIWSAACSSGQEPYSVSMIIEECLQENTSIRNLNVEIIATDLSSEILDQAKKGIYDRLSINRGLSDERLKRFFDLSGKEQWQISRKLCQRINFRPLNLQESYTALGKFDIVFCRNVLIYFSAALKKDILTRIHATLKPGGYLYLGSSESLAMVSNLFEMVHCNPGVVYKAKPC